MPFVELRSHTAFSFGDGAVTPEALAERAAALGYPAIGLTDAADFGGIPRFALEAERPSAREQRIQAPQGFRQIGHSFLPRGWL